MPETDLSRRKLRDHLRRCWIIYTVGILLLCFANNLVYTVTRPGFSDDETLKIMLVNADVALSDAEYAAFTMDLLPKIQAEAPEVQVLEFEPLAGITDGDPNSAMLMKVKLISGYGDIYLTDGAAFSMLAEQGACLNLNGIQLPGWESVACADVETGVNYTGGFHTKTSIFSPGINSDGRLYISIATNTTDQESAFAALPLLADAITE